MISWWIFGWSFILLEIYINYKKIALLQRVLFLPIPCSKVFQKLTLYSIKIYIKVKLTIIHGLKLQLFAIECNQKLILLPIIYRCRTRFHQRKTNHLRKQWRLIYLNNPKIVFKILCLWLIQHAKSIDLLDCFGKECHEIWGFDIFALGHLP